MKIFKLDEIYSVVCIFKGTRSGFKHTATLMKNGLQVYETKVCYLNRTWERFEYESVLRKLIQTFWKEPIVQEKYLTAIEKEN
jgi:hypothetical protein